MLTHRDYSSQVAFITGREAEGKEDSNIDWPLLAKFPGTIVFYMGVGNLQFIADQLIQNGAKSDTPAALIADATLPTQRIAQAPLSRITEKCKQEKIEPPAIIIIGPAAKSDDSINWFMKKTLFGKSIVITRDRHGNAELAGKIIKRSGNPVAFPTIKLKSLTRTNQFIETLAKLSEFNWIIFTSVNGVSFFFEALEKLNKDARVFASAKIAAIGTQTAGRLRQFGIIPDFIPTEFTSAELGKQLIAFRNLKNKKVLLLRSEAASNQLVDILVTAGADVTDTPVYTIEPEETEPDWLIDRIKNGQIDWLTFASPSAAGYFFQQITPESVNSSSSKVASIGPVTSKQLQDLNIAVDTEAEDHTFDALLDAIESTAR
jgi:uroporphyrinogen III methyltransferase/synthase